MKPATRFGLYAFAGAALTGFLLAAPTLWIMLRGGAEANSLVAAVLAGRSRICSRRDAVEAQRRALTR
jgi:hypothetical protein